MDKEDSQKSILNQIKSAWNSLPELIKLVGTILSIAIALKVLFPAAVLEINNFDANPDIIEPGESSILDWKVSGADNITIEPGIGAVSSNGSLSVTPSETTTYKLIASDDGEEKVALCTVTIKEELQEPLLISSFDASPESIKTGESATLNWHVSGVSNVTIEPDIGITEPAGTKSVSPAQTTTYKLTASNGNKEDVAYCIVTVDGNLAVPEGAPAEENLTPSEESLTPAEEGQSSTEQDQISTEESQASQENLPSISSFNADPDIVAIGESSVLSWSVTSATKVSIEPEVGTVSLTGSQRIFPDKNTTYTLTATNELGSVDATKIVYVQKPSEPTSSELISTPKQVSPADGTVFDNSTSGVTLEWTAVSGASSYTVEIDAYDSSSGLWLSESAGSQIISGIGTTSHSFEFPSQSPGRWRVWAVGADGKESEKSSWWTFNHTV
jgi:hypothetical protein